MTVRPRLRAPFRQIGAPEPPPADPPPAGANVPEPPHPALGGAFDPRTYDFDTLAGLSDPALLVSRDSNLSLHTQPDYTAANVDAGQFIINVNNLLTPTAKVSNSRAKNVTVAAKANHYVEVDHCELTSPVASTYSGGGPLWLHHSRTRPGGDSVGNFRPLLSNGGFTLIEYNDLQGAGYVPWLSLAGSTPVPFTASGSTITAPAHGFAAGQRVLLAGSDVFGTGLPAPARQQELFWVHSVISDSAFRVQTGTKTTSTLPIGQAGAALTFTSAGSGSVQAGAVDGLHADGVQVSLDGWTTIRRNRIAGHPNASVIIKSDITSSDALGNPIRNVRVEDNLLNQPGGFYIYVRAGDSTATSGFKSRPQFITIINNWFVGNPASTTCISSGNSPSDHAVFVESEQARSDAYDRQLADPAAMATARSALKPTSRDAATWVVWANNRRTGDGSLIVPPGGYYTGL